jgi:hypothetical protein
VDPVTGETLAPLCHEELPRYSTVILPRRFRIKLNSLGNWCSSHSSSWELKCKFVYIVLTDAVRKRDTGRAA